MTNKKSITDQCPSEGKINIQSNSEGNDVSSKFMETKLAKFTPEKRGGEFGADIKPSGREFPSSDETSNL